MPASPGASPLIPRWAWWTLLGAVLGVALSGYVLYEHASEWLRSKPRVSRCAVAASRLLKRPEPVTGVEPHATPSGETVWLRPNEDRAIRCLNGVDERQAQKLAAAFALLDDEPRAEALLEVVRELPADPEKDRVVYTAYLCVSGALAGLPQDLPVVAEGTKEIEGLMDCRFDRGGPCPARPSIPILVWVPGVPAALALVFLLGLFGRASVLGILRWRRRKREERAARRARRRAKRARREARAAREAEKQRKEEARKAAAAVLATPDAQ